jgi:hypothetical protein
MSSQDHRADDKPKISLWKITTERKLFQFAETMAPPENSGFLCADLLSRVIPYVGQHEWAFVAPVSKYWCYYYYKWLLSFTPSLSTLSGQHIMCNDYTATAYVATVVSESRLAESLTYALTTNMKQLQFAAGRRAPLRFLQQTARIYKLQSNLLHKEAQYLAAGLFIRLLGMATCTCMIICEWSCRS